MPASPTRGRRGGASAPSFRVAARALLPLALLLAAASFSASADQAEYPEPLPLAGLLTPRSEHAGDPVGTESTQLEGLPSIGFWMLDAKGGVANWLGIRAGGKKVAEPINIIIVDKVSPDEETAKARLERALAESGFPARSGHSKGYSALIGGIACPELLVHSKATFSDASFLSENDHGRIFGPYDTGSGFVFVAAFSRERPDTFRMRHVLVSFNVARDNVAGALEASGGYRIAGFAPLGNALFWSPTRTTWDHDGNAVLIEAEADLGSANPDAATTGGVVQPAAPPPAAVPSAAPPPAALPPEASAGKD
ncbi:MAG: hypothetical protein M0001_15700 [Treponema sp.]|nr:hypothetical protein [Treponema sp.]